MASTKKMVMVTTLLTVVRSVTGACDETESLCSRNNLPVWNGFDPKAMEGTWYAEYQTNTPPYFDSIVLMWYNCDYIELNDTFNGLTTFVVCNRTVVYKDNTCFSSLTTYNADKPGKLLAAYESDGTHLMKNDAYMLVANDNVLVAYHEFMVDGIVSKDFTSLTLAVRNVSAPVSFTLEEKWRLQKFCGKAATSLTFFHKNNFDYNATCA